MHTCFSSLDCNCCVIISICTAHLALKISYTVQSRQRRRGRNQQMVYRARFSRSARRTEAEYSPTVTPSLRTSSFPLPTKMVRLTQACFELTGASRTGVVCGYQDDHPFSSCQRNANFGRYFVRTEEKGILTKRYPSSKLVDLAAASPPKTVMPGKRVIGDECTERYATSAETTYSCPRRA